MEKIYLIIIVTAIILRIFEKPIIYKLIDKSTKDIYYLKNFYSDNVKNKLRNLISKASNKS